MQLRSRLLATQDRRTFLKFFSMGVAAAATVPDAFAQEVPPPPEPAEPLGFVERMVRLAHRPVIAARSIIGRSSRMPAIVVMDDEGNYIYGRLDYQNGPYSVPPRGVRRSEDRAEWIAAQHQFTASTTKVVALLAAIDWIKEQAALGPREGDASPIDPLLHNGLRQYAFVLGRKVPLTPRINTGGIMFHREIDPRGTIDELTVDEVLRFSEMFSTNDLLAYFNRYMSLPENGGKSLSERMRTVCERLNMTDSTFPTVHGMGSTARDQRIDCRSTAAEMMHALRVLDVLNPEFAPYVQQVRFYPENEQLSSLRDEMRPNTQYIEGPARGSQERVVQVAATINEPLIDDSGRDLNAAYVPPPVGDEPAAPGDDTGPADDGLTEDGQGDSSDTATDGPDTTIEDEGPRGGYAGVRMLKSGQLGQEKNRRGRWLKKARRTSWRTTVGMASRVIDGIERKIYFFTSSDSAGQRQNAIREAVREGFDRLEIRSRMARAEPPRDTLTTAYNPRS